MQEETPKLQEAWLRLRELARQQGFWSVGEQRFCEDGSWVGHFGRSQRPSR